MVMAGGASPVDHVSLFRERLARARFCLDEALAAIQDEAVTADPSNKQGDSINGNENADSKH